MFNSPEASLFLVAILLVVAVQMWRRTRIRRALRGLPTPMRRLLGPEPLFLPPDDAPLPEGLRAYARMHKRTGVVIYLSWGLAAIWLLFVLSLVLKGHAG